MSTNAPEIRAMTTPRAQTPTAVSRATATTASPATASRAQVRNVSRPLAIIRRLPSDIFCLSRSHHRKSDIVAHRGAVIVANGFSDGGSRLCHSTTIATTPSSWPPFAQCFVSCSGRPVLAEPVPERRSMPAPRTERQLRLHLRWDGFRGRAVRER